MYGFVSIPACASVPAPKGAQRQAVILLLPPARTHPPAFDAVSQGSLPQEPDPALPAGHILPRKTIGKSHISRRFQVLSRTHRHYFSVLYQPAQIPAALKFLLFYFQRQNVPGSARIRAAVSVPASFPAATLRGGGSAV